MTFDPADDSLLKVVVDVVDIDDNAPSFSRKTFTGGISTDSGFGDTVLTLHAHDPDTNGEVSSLLNYIFFAPYVCLFGVWSRLANRKFTEFKFFS